jgi:hypothetical protein
MKKIKKLKTKYAALSLVELIISIGVAGITLLVLMTIAANNMKEAVRYERHDALTRLAMDGALVIRRHAESVNDKKQEGIFFGPPVEDILPRCYRIEREEDPRVVFDTSYSPSRIGEESDLEVDVIYDSRDLASELGDTLYMAYCLVERAESPENYIYIGDILTGYINCGDCEIEEYSYNIIVSIRKEVDDED